MKEEQRPNHSIHVEPLSPGIAQSKRFTSSIVDSGDLWPIQLPNGLTRTRPDVYKRKKKEKKENKTPLYAQLTQALCKTHGIKVWPIQWFLDWAFAYYHLIEGLGFYLGLLELKNRGSLGFKLGPFNERRAKTEPFYSCGTARSRQFVGWGSLWPVQLPNGLIRTKPEVWVLN